MVPPKGRLLVTVGACAGGALLLYLLYALGYGEGDLANWLKFFLGQFTTEVDISG